jgi:Mg2+-importing ATPase
MTLSDTFRNLRRVLKPPPRSIQCSPLLTELATADSAAALRRLDSSPAGLSDDEVARRLERYGENVVARDDRHSRLRLFWHAVLNPLVLLLAVLATVSLLTGDARAAIVMSAMIVLGVGLRFVQEARANDAAEKLRAMIRVTATVMRDGQPLEEQLARLVPGDIVHLSGGDMIPADVRILT